MIVVASENGKVGIGAAIDILRRGGSALDAVEAACVLVEDDPDDHSVGTGGYPNAIGEVELDAALMEGTTRRAGAVAALRDYPHPIQIARAIMDHLPQHVLLAGDGAARFARERGFSTADLLTGEAKAAYVRHLAAKAAGDKSLPTHEEIAGHAQAATEPSKFAGTVNFLARDGDGRIAAAVSTSGWAFKYAGRVGDSPLIGAGLYCDDRYGACACTGIGEWSMRASLARMAVYFLQSGLALDAACEKALADLRDLPLAPHVPRTMDLIALDIHGNPAGFSTQPDRYYVYQHPDDETFVRALRRVYDIDGQ